MKGRREGRRHRQDEGETEGGLCWGVEVGGGDKTASGGGRFDEQNSTCVFTCHAHNSCRYIVLCRAPSGRGEGSSGLPRAGGQKGQSGAADLPNPTPSAKTCPFLVRGGEFVVAFVCIFF